MTNNLPHIIIADDHEMFKDAIESMLELEEIAHVVASASNGLELLDLVEKNMADIVLIDIDMPKLNGIEATKKIKSKYPDMKIIVLSMFGEEKYYREMIEAGANGFVLKSSGKSELQKAITEVFNGESFFSNELLLNIINKIGNFKNAPALNKNMVSFTDREAEIMQYMCKGLSTQEIAENLCLSAKTVENYRVKLLQKTNCKNSVELVVYAIKHNIIEI